MSSSFMEIKRFVNSGNTPLNKSIGVGVDNSVLLFRDNVKYTAVDSSLNGTIFDIQGRGRIHCVSVFPYLLGPNSSSYSSNPYKSFTFNLYKDGEIFREGTITNTTGGSYKYFGVSMMSKEYVRSKIVVKTDKSLQLSQSYDLTAPINSNQSSLSANLSQYNGGLSSKPFNSMQSAVLQILQDDVIEFNEGIKLTIDGTYAGSSGNCYHIIVYELD